MNMQPAVYQNHWKRCHDSLGADQGKRYKARIEYILCISQSAFYRKIKWPDRFLTTAEKWDIARVYQLAETYLFPELEALAEETIPTRGPHSITIELYSPMPYSTTATGIAQSIEKRHFTALRIAQSTEKQHFISLRIAQSIEKRHFTALRIAQGFEKRPNTAIGIAQSFEKRPSKATRALPKTTKTFHFPLSTFNSIVFRILQSQ